MNYKKALAGNKWKYGLFSITGRRVFWPLLTVYFLTFPDNTLQQIGFFMAIGQIGGFLFEVPSGYISDKIGHKRALIIAKGVLALSTAMYLIGGNFWFFVLGSIFFSMSIAFVSGTITAFMHETLAELGEDDQFSRIMGKIRSRTLIVTAILLALIPLSVEINIRLPLLIAFLLDIAGFFVALSFIAPRKTHIETSEIKKSNFKEVLREGVQHNFFPIIIFSALLQALLMGTGTFRDVYQQFLGIEIVYLGVLFALSRLFASFVSNVVYKLKNIFTVQQYFLVEILFFTPLLFLIGYLENKWVVAALFIITIGTLWGRGDLNKHYELEYISSAKFKATLLSFRGLLVNLLFAGANLLIGFLIGRFSYSAGYIYFAGVSFILLIVAYLMFRTIGHQRIAPSH